MSECQIYILIDPFTMRPFYVGCTTLQLKQRLAVHISKATANVLCIGVNKERNNYIKKIIYKGKRPLICVVELCSIEKSDTRERFYYKKLNKLGFDLLQADCFVYSKTFNRFAAKAKVSQIKK